MAIWIWAAIAAVAACASKESGENKALPAPPPLDPQCPDLPLCHSTGPLSEDEQATLFDLGVDNCGAVRENFQCRSITARNGVQLAGVPTLVNSAFFGEQYEGCDTHLFERLAAEGKCLVSCEYYSDPTASTRAGGLDCIEEYLVDFDGNQLCGPDDPEALQTCVDSLP